MNTYRITITTRHEPDQEPRMLQFDVDALRSNTAIAHVLLDFGVSFLERDLQTITSELYATSIFPPNEKKIRNVRYPGNKQ